MELNSKQYCRKCGQLIPENSRFCINCGATVDESQESNEAIDTFSRTNKEGIIKKVNLAFTVVLLFLGIFTIIALFLPFIQGKYGDAYSAFDIMCDSRESGKIVGFLVLAFIPLIAVFLSLIKWKQYPCWITFFLGIYEIVNAVVGKKSVSDMLGYFSAGAGCIIFEVAGALMICIGFVEAILFVVGSERSGEALKKLFIAFGLTLLIALMIPFVLSSLLILCC